MGVTRAECVEVNLEAIVGVGVGVRVEPMVGPIARDRPMVLEL